MSILRCAHPTKGRRIGGRVWARIPRIFALLLGVRFLACLGRLLIFRLGLVGLQARAGDADDAGDAGVTGDAGLC